MPNDAYADSVWRPGQPLDPTAQIMGPRELSDRLLKAEKILDDLSLGDMPISDLRRDLEQTWVPDPATLFAAGSVTRETLAVSWTGGSVAAAGSRSYTVPGGPDAWTVVRNAAGDYTVTFPPFKATPLAFCLPATATTARAAAKTNSTVQFILSGDSDFDWMVWGK